MRRGASIFVVAVGVVLLLGSNILYTQRVVAELRREAERSGRMYARVYEALASPAEDAPAVFLEVAREIRESRVPLLQTDPSGTITAAANTPFDRRVNDPTARTDSAVLAYIAALDRQNVPIPVGASFIHIGDTPLVNGLRIIPLVQTATLAHAVEIAASSGDEPLMIHGDAVLLEWALEALMKNAVDALAGRGGRIYITSQRVPEGVRIRVADDGPGIPRELRARVFDAGFSTKDHGWGVGLSLARRIIEENHGGQLVLIPSQRGATFDVILH